jgi:predicted flap endonuclease-1-like 5' DNA nuclease
MSRSTRTMLAVMLFLMAGALIVNHIVAQAPISDWLLTVGVLILGVILALYPAAEPQTVSLTDHEALAAEPAPSLAAASEAPVESAAPAPAQPEPAHAEPAPAAEVTPPAAVVKPDDLKVIEGIGPKMAQALIDAGISTYARLAAASEDEIRAAIEAAGMRLAPSIGTWAEQASYAARGDWDGLKAFQSTLTGGRRE